MLQSAISSLDTQRISQLKCDLLTDATRLVHERADNANTRSTGRSPVAERVTTIQTRCPTRRLQLQTKSPPTATHHDAARHQRPNEHLYPPFLDAHCPTTFGYLDSVTGASPAEMHHSVLFSSAASPLPFDGDTQVMPSQIYRDYTSLTISQSGEEHHLRGFVDLTNPTDAPKTLNEGDTGHIDLFQEFLELSEEESQPQISDDEKDELAMDTQVQAKFVDESKRFRPKTPAMAGHKRNHHGDIVSSESKTPGSGLSTFFGSKQRLSMIGLTQVFNQTQAPSSPLPEGLPSDPIFERPSPGLPHLRHSSPALMMSSPVKQSRPEFQRSLTEPRDTYLPMHESQALRQQQELIDPRSQVSEIGDEVESEEDNFDSAENKVARRHERARIDREARREFEGFTRKHERRITHRRDRQGTASSAIGLVTPARSRKTAKEVWIVSDDLEADQQGHSDADSIEEYDELSQDIIRTSRKPNNRETYDLDGPNIKSSEQWTSKESAKPHSSQSSRHSHGFALTSHGAHWVLPEIVDGVQNATSHDRACEAPRLSQTVAVADSQPTNSETQYTIPPPRPIHPSSLDSRLFVSQSQGLSASSNARPRHALPGAADLDTSAIPQIPQGDRTVEDVAMDDECPRLTGVDRSSPPNMVPAQPGGVEEAQGGKVIDDIGQGMTRNTDRSAEHSAAGEPFKVILYSSSSSQQAFLTAPGTAQTPASERIAGNAVAYAVPETNPVSAAAPSSAAQTEPTPEPKVSGDANIDMSGDAQVLAAVANSNSTGLYETAYTHLSASKGSMQPNHNGSSPNKLSMMKGRIRTFKEIASDPTPPDAVREVDLEFAIMSGEDLEFQAIISRSSPVGPSKKRRKRQDGSALRKPAKELNLPPSVIPPSPKGSASAGTSCDALPTSSPLTSAAPSSSKSDDVPVCVPKSTPPSARKREAAGAEAFTRVRQAVRIRKFEPLGSCSAVPRRLGRRSGRSVTGNTTALNSIKPTPNPRPEVAETPQTFGKQSAAVIVQGDGPVLQEAVIISNKLRQEYGLDGTDARDTTDQGQTGITYAVASQAEPICAPDRVFALFKGGNMVFWPATFIGQTFADGVRYRIRFDDDTVDSIEPHHVCSLDLRLGDVVRVDLEKMRNKTYVVIGFNDHIGSIKDPVTSNMQRWNDTAGNKTNTTDVRGYQAVSLAVKQRDSLTANSTASDRIIVDAPISSIYLTQTMWARFRDRTFRPGEFIENNARYSTPVGRTCDFVTPASRIRRSNISAMANQARRSFRSASLALDTGLFAGMAFAITYACSISDNEEKDTVAKLIIEQGGTILDAGFDTLFRIPQLEHPTSAKTSPWKTSTAGKTVPSPSHLKTSPALQLSREAGQLGFTALIADKYSRRVKYLQALALGLPCLSGRWIIDSVKRGAMQPWERYLLPAGESSVLGGAVRSRTLALYDPMMARLEHVLDRRKKLLEGKSVLLVMGKGRAQEKRRANLFLTYALGAGKVGKVTDLAEARKIIVQGKARGGTDEGWDFVYVDGEEKEAQRALFGKGGVVETKKGRKRKRGEGTELERKVGDHVEKTDKSFKVVGDEFVVQSLILAALLEA